MKQYVVDAFTDKVFYGNPAAVCVTDKWLPDNIMMSIAKENNLSETAFTVKDGDIYGLRWFAPGGEIDLCGHATLATAFVITRFEDTDAAEVQFSTKSGTLTVTRKDDVFEMDFPAYKLEKIPVTEDMVSAFGVTPAEAYMGRDLLLVMQSEEEVRSCTPDLEKVKALEGLVQHITARGAGFDCVSRSFAPKLAIPEDPVCGSGHCHIFPYWGEKLGKRELIGYQASERGGVLYGRLRGERVKLSGKAALFSEAQIYI